MNIDSVHPLFRGKLNGDDIRSRFETFELPKPSGIKHKGPYNNIILSVFHSNALYVGTALNLKERLPELKGFKFTNPINGGMESRGGFYNVTAVPLYDSMPMLVAAYGINPSNKSLYQFRVIQDKNKVVLPWQEVRLFSRVMTYYRYNADGTEQKEMALLGEFVAPVGSSLTVEVRNIKIPDTAYAISAVWIKRSPSVISVFTSATIKEFLEVYKYQWKHDFYKPNQLTYYGDIKMNPVDSLLKKPDVFKHQDNTLFFYLKDKVKYDSLVEYNLVKGADSAGWKGNRFDPSVIRFQQLPPGNYTLLLRYAFQRQSISRYPFTILPAWYQTLGFKILTGIIAMIIVAFVIILYINWLQRKKLKAAALQKQRVSTELKSIRSQFNPHFVFNALNSIQGLITKNDTAGAHQYLSEFSTLMRESLNGSDREMISIAHETEILQKYLNLEQLRFGFRYQIAVDDAIDRNAVEVPALLLQPLVENAVKHGIAGLQEKGCLQIDFKKAADALVATVTDNGKGFDAVKETAGFGLRLTRERIALLNETLHQQQIRLSFDSGEKGTTGTIYFKNWLL
ncbi:histidine kinase [Niabella pedocola]|uniref:Histidine kinase n=1 Tax=Niabella pedocola TaxID=1752077 RepID=A0ABS8PX67_9BACT|nr:histidine kinase [Niabella pedocola]MCD2424506.1 histidine kinase [Niabella pedocola]